jgi:hypothetical protein
VKKLLEKLRDAKIDHRFDFIEIPEFNLLGVDVYKQWLLGEAIRDELKEFYTGGALMIRSSAVYSEDGEAMTGAGVYQSVALEEDSTFEDFVGGLQRFMRVVIRRVPLNTERKMGLMES